MICSFCNNNIFIKTINKYSDIFKKYIKYYFCSKCYSIHQFPIPDTKLLKQYYKSYLKIKKDMNPGYLDTSNITTLFKERDLTLSEIGFNKDWFKYGSNVELGCANGHFLQYLKNQGAKNIIGIDISKPLINSIKIKNIKTMVGDLSLIKEKSINNLFLFNILEHIEDINSLINQIKSRLSDNGKIIIEVPITGLISRFFSKNWRFLMPYEHLHIPSFKGLNIFLKTNNLKIIGKTRFGSGFTTGTIPFFLKSNADFFAKKLSFGDRGCFLIIKE